MKKRSVIAAIILFILLSFSAYAGDTGVFTAHFLDVGQGLCVLLESDGEYAVYDGGGPESSRFVVSYLKELGVSRLDLVIASHYDLDHVSGLAGVLNVFPVLEIWGPDYDPGTNVYDSLMKKIQEHGYVMHSPSRDETFSLGGTEIRVLSDGLYHEKENDRSIVISVSRNDSRLLITGDLTSDGEQGFIDSGVSLSSDILVLGHHGSSSSTSWSFLSAVKPSSAVISCGIDNEWGHPSKRTMERIRTSGISVYRTDRQGTITASFVPGGSIIWNKACSDDLSGGTYDEDLVKRETAAEIPEDVTYVLNGSSFKFHRPECEMAGAVNPRNRVAFTGTREEAIELGYEPCGKCRP
ncbi:MAG: MBL fold metallo-hydrolase [Blautia sp.]|nr:MBL fold metallo-hydrolase [Blautia sp.]